MLSENLLGIESDLDTIISDLRLELSKNINDFSTPDEKIQEKARLVAQAFGIVERNAEKDAEVFKQIQKFLRQKNEAAAQELYQDYTNSTAEQAAIEINFIRNVNLKFLMVSPGLFFQKQSGDSLLAWAREIINELKKGNIVRAIIIYRQNTNAGLKEAKGAVEAIMCLTGKPLL